MMMGCLLDTGQTLQIMRNRVMEMQQKEKKSTSRQSFCACQQEHSEAEQANEHDSGSAIKVLQCCRKNRPALLLHA